MGRDARKRQRKSEQQRKVRRSGPLGPEADLPPDVAEFLTLMNEADDGYTAESSEGGMVWTIRDADGNVAMEFRTGPAAERETPPEELGLGPACMNLGALWDDPEFRRQLDAGLVNSYGQPQHPEGRDFFSEHHAAHDHDH